MIKIKKLLNKGEWHHSATNHRAGTSRDMNAKKNQKWKIETVQTRDTDLLGEGIPGKPHLTTPAWRHSSPKNWPARHLPNHGQFRRLTADTRTTSGRRGYQRIEQSRSSRNHLAACKATPITYHLHWSPTHLPLFATHT